MEPSTVRLMRARRMAMRIRAKPCKVRKVRCSNFRPCARCTKSGQESCTDLLKQCSRDAPHRSVPSDARRMIPREVIFSLPNMFADQNLFLNQVFDFGHARFKFNDFVTTQGNTLPPALQVWFLSQEVICILFVLQLISAIRLTEIRCRLLSRGRLMYTAVVQISFYLSQPALCPQEPYRNI